MRRDLKARVHSCWVSLKSGELLLLLSFVVSIRKNERINTIASSDCSSLFSTIAEDAPAAADSSFSAAKADV